MLFVYPAVFHKEDNAYWVEFPDLEGCQTYGETLNETMAYAQEALAGYLLTLLEEKYREITGEELTKYYRPPQGKYSMATLKHAREMGYRTFFWSLAYVDWLEDDQPTKEEAFEKLLGRIHPGAIVLLHSTSSTNAQILDELLCKWEKMGYQIRPLSEIE